MRRPIAAGQFARKGRANRWPNGRRRTTTAPASCDRAQQPTALPPIRCICTGSTSVVARDGVPTTPYNLNTLTVAPGEVYDAIFTADIPGVWAFDCHVLSHAEAEHGMHGMVTAVIVE